MGNKKVVILGGGTVSHVRSHLALAAPAYGATAELILGFCLGRESKLDVKAVFTKMAGNRVLEMTAGSDQTKQSDELPNLDTVEDIDRYVTEKIIPDLSIKILFFNIAMADFNGAIIGDKDPTSNTGKYGPRLSSSEYYHMVLAPNPKVIQKIRKERKDIFLVGFKTTTDATSQEQYTKGLKLLKESSCNLVLANDLVTRNNIIITPEEASYHETTNRFEAIQNLVDMAYLRSHLTFTRSTVVSGDSVAWTSDEVPGSLRSIVDHCINKKAYKEFNGATVGHFAVKLNDKTFLTSKRKTNFNDLKKIGLVKVETDGPDSVISYGYKPSVGGQSQRIVFSEHQDSDCIVHFHCPMKDDAKNPIRVMSQREYECGSHECGKNTSNGLQKFGNLWAVMLSNHGPNIVFNKDIDPNEVINFIEDNFDLSGKTGGYLV